MKSFKKLVGENGISNIVFLVPISIFSINSTIKEKDDVLIECYSKESFNRKAIDGYKIELETREKFMRNSFFDNLDVAPMSQSFYVMDFFSLCQSYPGMKAEVRENAGTPLETINDMFFLECMGKIRKTTDLEKRTISKYNQIVCDPII